MNTDGMILTKERQCGVMSNVKKEDSEEEGDGTSTCKVFVKPKKRRRIWRHAMELPCHGRDWEKLWNFVAAHVEDDSRKKLCPLAVKAWEMVHKSDKVAYRERTKEGMFPSVMPLFRQAKFGDSKLKW